MAKKKSSIFIPVEGLLVVVILLIIGGFFFYDQFFSFPSHLHAWSQGDRYALTIGYLNNGLDFFRPSTLNLYPEYPPHNGITFFTGITSAAMPLPEYLAALVMKFTGVRQPWVLRLIVLLSGGVGLYFLFRFMRTIGGVFSLSLLTVLMVFSAPVFTYYLNAFIPSIPALALSWAAFYFYANYLRDAKTKHFLLALILLTLATLIRPPFLMPLVAMVAVHLSFTGFKRQKIKEYLLILLHLTIIGIFSYHDKSLQHQYGSMFNSQLMPAESLGDWMALMAVAWKNWSLSYWSLSQYVLLLMVPVVLFLMRKKIFKGYRLQLFLIAILNLGAGLLYSFAMAKQFPMHDYYFLDSLFLPLVLLLALGFSAVEIHHRRQQIPLAIALLIFAPAMLWASFQKQNERYTSHSWDLVEATRLNFVGSDAFLSENGIRRDAKMMVLDAYSSNIPLLMMDREGFTVIETSAKKLTKALQLPFDYVVIQNRGLGSDVLRNLPELTNKLEPIANNGKIGLYKYSASSLPQNWLNLLLVNSLTKSFIPISDSVPLCMDQETAFVNIKDTLLTGESEVVSALLFQADAFTDQTSLNGLNLVVDAKDDAGFSFYDSRPLSAFYTPNQSTQINVFVGLPEQMPVNTHVKVYLWNPGKNNVCLQPHAVLFTKYYLHQKN